MAKWINTNTGEIVYNNDKEALDAYERTYIEGMMFDRCEGSTDICDFESWIAEDSDITMDIPEGAAPTDEYNKAVSELCNKYSGAVTAEYFDGENQLWSNIEELTMPYSNSTDVDDMYECAIDWMVENDAEYGDVDVDVLREKYESMLWRLSVAGIDDNYLYYRNGKCIGWNLSDAQLCFS